MTQGATRLPTVVVYVKGVKCNTIDLGHGKRAIVYARDYPKVSRYKWFLCQDGVNQYAKTSHSVRMHHLILKRAAGKETDHINGNGLDNRRCNLRLVTRSQNSANKMKSGGTSSFKGVTRIKHAYRWLVQITCNYKNFYLGIVPLEMEVEAAKMYDRAARKLFGKHARLNFPRKGEQGIND